MSKEDRFKAICPNCDGPRWCEVRGSYTIPPPEDYQLEIEWRILSCCGCETTFVQERQIDYEYTIPGFDELGDHADLPSVKEFYWPPRVNRKPPEWLYGEGIPEQLKRIIAETFTAYDANAIMLTAMGVRAAFDLAAVELGCDQNDDLIKKLRHLVDVHKLTEADFDRLETLVEAGNATSHRGWIPTESQLATLVEVLTHFVGSHLVSAKQAEALGKRAKAFSDQIPKRQRRSVAKPVQTA